METSFSAEKIGSVVWFGDHHESLIAKKFLFHFLDASGGPWHLLGSFHEYHDANTFYQLSWVKSSTVGFARTKGSHTFQRRGNRTRWHRTKEREKEAKIRKHNLSFAQSSFGQPHWSYLVIEQLINSNQQMNKKPQAQARHRAWPFGED